MRAWCLSLLVLACASQGPAPPQRLEDGRYVMGTIFELTLHGPDAAALVRARDRCFALAERLDAMLSRHRTTSELSRLNAAKGEPLAVSPELADVLRASLLLSRQTRSSFDATIGPLVSLWIRAAERARLPSEVELAEARRHVGPEQVRFGPAGRVTLAPGARLDLGGIAKGFALDRMREVLREEGVEIALLSFGQSSVWALGAPPGAPGWTLLVRAPEGGFVGTITLRDQALSVSGSLGQWSEIEGRRYGHVVDPRTGMPLTRRRQALVVAREAALAEAYSKALLILGEAEGREVVEAEQACEGLLLDAGGARFATRGFASEAGFEPLDAVSPGS